MVERFPSHAFSMHCRAVNGRIEDVPQSHHFRSGEQPETTLNRYVRLYNQQLPQSALGSKTPLQAMKEWFRLKPELFKKQPYYLTGCDSYGLAQVYLLAHKVAGPLSEFWGVEAGSGLVMLNLAALLSVLVVICLFGFLSYLPFY